jgi:uncharacterized protein YhhL (DUF1145 family)
LATFQGQKELRRTCARVIDLGLIPLLLFSILHYPDYRHGILMFWDEGQHLACIYRLFQGEIIFRDIYNISAPLPELIPCLMMKFSTIDVSVLRSFYYYGTLLSLFTVYLTGLRLVKDRLAAVLLVLLGAKYFVYNIWASRWGGFRVGTAYVAILLLWAYLDSGKRKWLGACGVAVAGALLFSPEMGIISFLIVSLVIVAEGMLFDKPPRPLQGPIRKPLPVFLVAFAAGLVPWLVYCLANGALWDYVVINFIDIPFRLTKALPYSHDLLPFPDLWWRRDRWISVWKFFSSSTGLYTIAWLILGIEILRLILARFKNKWNRTYTKRFAILIFGIYLLLLAGLHTIAWLILGITIMCLIFAPSQNRWNITQVKRFTILVFGIYLLVLARRNIHVTAPQLNYSLSPVLILFVAQLKDASSLLAGNIWNRLSSKPAKESVTASLFSALPAFLLFGGLFAYMAYDNHGRPYQLLEPYHHLPDRLLEALPPDVGLLNLPRCRNIRMPEGDARLLEKVTTFITENTSPSEPLFAFPMDGRYYFLTDRRNPTRFDIAINVAINKAYEQEAVRDLEKSPPSYVIYDRKAPRLGNLPNEERVPLLSDYLVTHYRPVLEIEGTVVMERVGSDIRQDFDLSPIKHEEVK